MPKQQSAGSLLADVKNLAVPFSLLLAKNGIEYFAQEQKKKVKTITKKKPATSPRKASVPKPPTVRKASQHQIGGDADHQRIDQLALDIRNLLARYSP